MTDTFDVLIVGGGIAGASAGYELARAGYAVAVLEREDLPDDVAALGIAKDTLAPR